MTSISSALMVLPARRHGFWMATATVLAAALLGGCTVKNEATVVDAAPVAPGVDAPVGGSCEPGAPGENRQNGEMCDCDRQCGSGACVSGLCCTSRCSGSCESCELPGKVGTCSPVPAGQPPAKQDACLAESPSSCGRDGTCDGAGECRKYPDNTVCAAGTCQGTSITGTKTCQGGTCTAAANQICAPFSCNGQTSQCFSTCTSDDQCAPGQACKEGSCGQKPPGQACTKASECESGFCVDGVCCNTACTGACLTCKDASEPGVCKPVPAGVEDPRNVCVKENESTCGFSGLCNGQGGCSRYTSGTVCQAASCAGGSVMPEGKCNGQGSCVLGQAFTCAPFACSAGACKTTCSSSADCVGGNTCTNGSCGLKQRGQACLAGSECASGHCADGVCCNESCDGQCRNCALANSRGLCTNVPANTLDPRIAAGVTDAARVCKDEGAASCGTNGMCNGAGACSRYPSGTVCRAGVCDPTTNSATGASTCNGSGACLSPAPTTCAPFRCSGSRCADTCGGNTDCVSPNVCTAGSCGKKTNGQVCSNDLECGSGHCEQGICCASACDKSCFSCAIPGKQGLCSAVTAGALDPKDVCKDNGPTECGTDGTCNGAGGCRLYDTNTMCKPQTCANGMSTAASFCSGTGICISGATRACVPYTCNAAGNACFDSCVSDDQCLSPDTCNAGTCGKKGLGATCASADDCASGFCRDGLCCDGACTGLCRACNLSGSLGVCVNVPDGVADSENSCPATTMEMCGNDGTCNGNGACSQWGPEISCSRMSCPEGSSTLTNPGSCNGSGSCLVGSPQSCGNFLCNATSATCKTTCTPETQTLDCKEGLPCVSINDVNTCGLKSAGVSCASTSECAAGLTCVDGTCCTAPDCGECQSCKNAEGVCKNVAAGAQDLDTCTLDTSSACGTIGICNGSGACQFAASGTVCGTSTCTADGKEIRRSCNGAGTCGETTISCPNNLKCVGTACKTSCDSDADCLAPATCRGRSGKCQKSGD